MREIILPILHLISTVICTATFEAGDIVPVYGDRFAPYNSPRESYSLENAPTCEFWGLSPTRVGVSLGDVLQGKRRILNPKINITWPNPINDQYDPQRICSMNMGKHVISTLDRIIRRRGWYLLEVGGHSVYGFFGNVTASNETEFFAHKTFVLHRQDDQLLGVNIIPSVPVPLLQDKHLQLTYNVRYIFSPKKGTTPRLLDTATVQEQKSEWLSLGLSFLLACFLSSLILYIAGASLTNEWPSSPSFRSVKGQLFRVPNNPLALNVCLSTGSQLFCAFLLSNLIALFRTWEGYQPVYTGSMIIWSFLLTQFVNGYIGNLWHRFTFGPVSQDLPKLNLMQMSVFPSALLMIELQLNTMYVAYGTTQAMGTFALLWKFIVYMTVVVFPLHLVGARLGRRMGQVLDSSLRHGAHQLRRPLPPKSRIIKLGLALMGGILPFSVLMLQLQFIYEAVWGHRVLGSLTIYIFSAMLVFAICLASTTIATTYIVLNREDYGWQWYTFGLGAAVGLYSFIFSLAFLPQYGHDTYSRVSYIILNLVGSSVIGIGSGAFSFAVATASLLYILNTTSDIIPTSPAGSV